MPSTHPLDIREIGLPPRLVKKLRGDEDIPLIVDTRLLRSLPTHVLQSEWRLTAIELEKINERLRAHGQQELPDVVERPKAERKPSLKGRCRKAVLLDGSDTPDGYVGGVKEGLTVACGRPNYPGKRACQWHWLASQPIEDQVQHASERRKASVVLEGEERTRVPEVEWPAGERWCSGCQDFVPLFYCRGSRCVAHASQAAHASMVKRVYDITAEDYQNLLAWQRGRCYICHQTPRARRLAIDHDHRTGEVRGLLCANDEWGCNRALAKILNDEAMARRVLEYVQNPPLARMLAGEASPQVQTGMAARAGSRRTADPFEGFLS